MGNLALHDSIRNLVQEQLPGAQVWLFGSRARGDQYPNSDYDLLIVTAQTLSKTDKLRYAKQLNCSLIDSLHIPVDLLITSAQELEKKSVLPGHVARTALREGVRL